MNEKKIVENGWPWGTRVVTETSPRVAKSKSRKRVLKEDAVDGVMLQKFISGVALAAKTSGMLDAVDSPKEILRALKVLITQPADLMREIRKMGASGSRATQAFRQVRKDL